jgi:hypothetical protein
MILLISERLGLSLGSGLIIFFIRIEISGSLDSSSSGSLLFFAFLITPFYSITVFIG